ncbi:aspartyl-tRNA(Asn)/glutamyl-tRNA(Gln) amidotransferase subunit A [Kribbella sp. VKM Ac-2527]|uniref:Aspartyl-tRNA(Asn)/glutamyl-tRNA(Gln) amidotransferase subunit A n=1 Tax=Kribbella caucasensis TaxID=2512215 RepID=A0A4R6J495_9ACTN|nr:amidase [Kribbella sp. VKM Ac-2527]TDO30200.1 aspartyl-tRNA(Asn)/glutamyl-tRNA(Gln) amidotransferase subunit A [Kribbella sp. VKM Ac-2527]
MSAGELNRQRTTKQPTTNRPTTEEQADGPMDTRVDRRSFLYRASALAAATTVGTLALPSVGYAAQPITTTAPTIDTPVRPEALADPTELTIAEAATLIRTGKLKPDQLVEAYLERISAYDATYQAFNLVLTDQALARARELGRRKPTGPLYGIPLAIKDNYYTRGIPTTANSYLFQKFEPPFDATAVRRLTAAGAIVLGKTQMGPLATTRATTPDGRITTVNAWTPADPSTDPGGSSSGSATAVASRMATSSTGTQTGGSITAPSNAQNLTGLKPTMGRVSLYGIVPLSYTRDHPGPLARDAMDAAIMLTAMAGEDPNDPRTQGLPPVPDLVTAASPAYRERRVKARWRTRIGVIPGYTAGTTETAAARRTALNVLDDIEDLQVVDVSLPDEWDVLTNTAFNNVRLPERSEPFLPMLRTDLRGFGVSVTGWLQGALLGANEFLIGQRAKVLLLQRVLDDLFEQCDVVVQTSPTPFDAIGLPELALPIGFTSSGVPIGTILGGKPFGEDRLLAVAAAYQAVTDWHHRRPADPVTALRAARAEDRGRLTAEEIPDLMQ